DVDPDSRTYGRQGGEVTMPEVGDELHHFCWNACSSALCPYSPHPHVERRYLVEPGLRSSRVDTVDKKPNARKDKIDKEIEPEKGVRLCWCSGFAEGFGRVRLAMASQRRCVGYKESNRNSSRTGRPREATGTAERF